MNLIDVHCHLNHEDFKNNLDEVIDRAKKAGVKIIIVSGTSPEGNQEVFKLSEKYPDIIKVSYGIYPIDALGLGCDEAGLPEHQGPIDLDKEFETIRQNLDKIISVGEVGMDFYWDQEHHQKQKENFRKIVKFVKSIKKPILIHSRKAEAECIEILEEEIGRKEIKKDGNGGIDVETEIPVIMHCFSGKKSLRSKAEELGYYFSIPPHIIKASNFQSLVKKTDLKRLLTETDAPWLSPFPNQKNEPAFVTETIKKIAEIKGISEEEVAKQVWENYEKIFGKKLSGLSGVWKMNDSEADEMMKTLRKGWKRWKIESA